MNPVRKKLRVVIQRNRWRGANTWQVGSTKKTGAERDG